MGKRINVYICDDSERVIIKVVLAAYRAKKNGMSAKDAYSLIDYVFGDNGEK